MPPTPLPSRQLSFPPPFFPRDYMPPPPRPSGGMTNGCAHVALPTCRTSSFVSPLPFLLCALMLLARPATLVFQVAGCLCSFLRGAVSFLSEFLFPPPRSPSLMHPALPPQLPLISFPEYRPLVRLIDLADPNSRAACHHIPSHHSFVCRHAPRQYSWLLSRAAVASGTR